MTSLVVVLAVVGWLFASLGTTLIVTRSVIFARFRALFPKPMGQAPFLGTLVRCGMCFGLWAGMLWAVIALAVLPRLPISTPALAVIVFAGGCAASWAAFYAQLKMKALGYEDVLKKDRHPWFDLPEADRAQVLTALATVELVATEEKTQAALKQARDLLTVKR